MQSDGNSWKIEAFREAITFELMITSKFCKLLLVRICLIQKFCVAHNLTKHVVNKL